MACCCINDDGKDELEFKASLPADEAAVPIREDEKEKKMSAEPEPVSFGSFEVTVPIRGKPLGLELDSTATVRSKGGLMVKAIKDGAIKDFNDSNPSQAICLYDEFTLVDEVTDRKAMKTKLNPHVTKLPEMLKLRLDRPRAFEVILVKPGMLGLKLDFKANSAGSVVEEILPDGLVTKWNSSHVESERVRPGDRIIEVNGTAYEGSEMMDVLKTENRLELKVLKYP